MRSIYLDYNATTPVRPEVVDEMSAFLAGPPGNPSSRHAWGRDAARAREKARERLAGALGCRPEEIVFTSGGTEADNLAIRGLADPGGREHVITAATEHEAILHTLDALERLGSRVTRLSVDSDGLVDPEALARAIAPDTALVTLMAANNETGALAPLAALGAACRERGVPFHTDAVQCFGKAPFRFDELPVDLASISSHKIGGPKGIGALVHRAGVRPHPMQTGGGQERGIRPGTENLPGIVGFGKAAELAAAEREAEGNRLSALRDRLEAGILRVWPAGRVNGAGAPRLPNTTNVTFPDSNGETLLIALDLEGIAVSTGAACNAGAADPSHVLLALGCTREEAAGSIRFSLGTGTTEAEIDEVLAVLPEIVSRVIRAGLTHREAD